MIKSLYIKDFILIDELEIEFNQGLNIITGETGSGKSILIDAIDMAFGARGSKDLIKTGKSKATIELTIDYKDEDINSLLKENDLEINNNCLVISREITQNSTKQRINGSIVSQSFIQKIRKYFLDIHSQHETYSFIQPKTHINLLDNYGDLKHKEILSSYKKAYFDYKTTMAELEELVTAKQGSEQKIDYLKFQINEIESAEIVDTDESETLENQRSVLINAEELKGLTYSSYTTLYNSENSIIDILSSIENKLIRASEYDETLSGIADTIASSAINLKEAAGELRDYSENLETNPQALDEIEERIDVLDKLKRKFGPELKDVLYNYEQFKNELDNINFSDEKVSKLEEQIKKLTDKLNVISSELTNSRKKLANTLSQSITKELVKLEMPKVCFSIDIQEKEEHSKTGKDEVEFLISPNTGESLKPLAKIASGGEISRVMLAIKCILAQNDLVNTVIFDEIDTGISGKTSQAVGEALATLATSHQILCITHQPIIAAMADEHIFVEKIQTTDSTFVEISLLQEQHITRALSKLAGGNSEDEDSLNFAAKLLKQAMIFKKSLLTSYSATN